MVAGDKNLDDKSSAGAATGLSIGHGIASITSKPRRAMTAGNARLVRASMDADLVQYDSNNQASCQDISLVPGPRPVLQRFLDVENPIFDSIHLTISRILGCFPIARCQSCLEV